MKSMLQEGSTIFKAIEKAWRNCGEPEEFTIKILEYGDKSFFGITKKPAVISINYDTRFQKKKSIQEPQRKEVIKQEFAIKSRGIIQDFEKNKNIPKAKTDAPVPRKKDFQHGWTKELANDVTFWLEDIIKVIEGQRKS